MQKGVNALKAAMCCGFLFSTALGAEVYRWTDENGVTQFTETPPPAGIEFVIADVPGSEPFQDDSGESPEDEAAQPESQSEEDPEALSAADQKRRDLEERRERRRAQVEAIMASCAQAKARLARIEPNPDVLFTNEEGETERMDDGVRVAEVEQLKEFIAKNCP